MELKNAERLTCTGQWCVEKYPLKLNLGKWSSSSNSAQLLAQLYLNQEDVIRPHTHMDVCIKIDMKHNWKPFGMKILLFGPLDIFRVLFTCELYFIQTRFSVLASCVLTNTTDNGYILAIAVTVHKTFRN